MVKCGSGGCPRRTRRLGRTSAAMRCRTGSPTSKRGWPKIREAKAELGAEAKAKAAAEQATREKNNDEPPRKPPLAAAPEPKAQCSLTRKHRSLWRTRSATTAATRCSSLPFDGIKANLGGNPDEVSADAGYCSAAKSSHAEPAADQGLHHDRTKEARQQDRQAKCFGSAFVSATKRVVQGLSDQRHGRGS